MWEECKNALKEWFQHQQLYSDLKLIQTQAGYCILPINDINGLKWNYNGVISVCFQKLILFLMVTIGGGFNMMLLNQYWDSNYKHKTDSRWTFLGNGNRNIWKGGLIQSKISYYIMMTSSNGSSFRVTDPLCGEFTCHRWIILIKGQYFIFNRSVTIAFELWMFYYIKNTLTIISCAVGSIEYFF